MKLNGKTPEYSNEEERNHFENWTQSELTKKYGPILPSNHVVDGFITSRSDGKKQFMLHVNYGSAENPITDVIEANVK
jgi:hypothetical protein